MGWSWSLFLAHVANSRRMRSLASIRDSLEMSDRGASLLLHQQQGGFWPYADNLGILGGRYGQVKSALDEAAESFEGVGLPVHETILGAGTTRALGVDIDSTRLAARACHERYGRCRMEFKYLLRRSSARGDELEVIIGHLTFLCPIRREILSIFYTLYRFMRKQGKQMAPQWPTVIEELQGFLGVMPLLSSGWWLPWSSGVHLFDASLHGCGACYSESSSEAVAAVGRVPEKSRHRLGAGEARLHAAKMAGFEYAVAQRKIVESGHVCPPPEEVDQRVADESVPEVPGGARNFKVALCSLWEKDFKDDIIYLEARALLNTVSRFSHFLHQCNMRVLVLGDHMPFVLPCSRMRAFYFKLVSAIRRFASLCLARSLKLASRWKPSGSNSSEQGAPRFDPSYDSSTDLSSLIGPSVAVSAPSSTREVAAVATPSRRREAQCSLEAQSVAVLAGLAWPPCRDAAEEGSESDSWHTGRSRAGSSSGSDAGPGEGWPPPACPHAERDSLAVSDPAEPQVAEGRSARREANSPGLRACPSLAGWSRAIPGQHRGGTVPPSSGAVLKAFDQAGGSDGSGSESSGLVEGERPKGEAARRRRRRELRRVRKLFIAAKDVETFGSVLEASALRTPQTREANLALLKEFGDFFGRPLRG